MTERLTVKDIAPEQYAAWRNHPVTQFMFQYFTDYAATLERAMLLEWRAGKAKLSDETEARGRVIQLTEIPELKWQSIERFYGIEPKPEDTEEANVRT